MKKKLFGKRALSMILVLTMVVFAVPAMPVWAASDTLSVEHATTDGLDTAITAALMYYEQKGKKEDITTLEINAKASMSGNHASGDWSVLYNLGDAEESPWLPDLETLVIRGVEAIPAKALGEAGGITAMDWLLELELPDATTIGEEALAGLSGLRSLTIPKVNKIGNRAFQDCASLTRFYFGKTPPVSLGVDLVKGAAADAIYFYYDSGDQSVWQAFRDRSGLGHNTPTLAGYSDPAPEAYDVALTQETGGAATVSATSAIAGETVSVEAAPEDGYTFSHWDISPSAVSWMLGGQISATASFRMPAQAVAVRPVFKEDTAGGSDPGADPQPDPDPDPVEFAVSLTQQTGGTATVNKTKSVKGEAITISATAASGYTFTRWAIAPSTVTFTSGSLTAASATFTMPEQAVTILPVYTEDAKTGTDTKTYAVTLSQQTGGTATVSPATAQAGEYVALNATPASGYTFSRWTVSPSSVSWKAGGLTTASAVFAMPAQAVTVTPVYTKNTETDGKEYTITLTQKTGGTTTVSHTKATAGTTVNLNVSKTTSGYSFSRWSVSPSTVSWTKGSSTATSASFTMPERNVTISPVFTGEDEDGLEKTSAIVREGSVFVEDQSALALVRVLSDGKTLTKGTHYTVHTADKGMELRLLMDPGSYKLRLEFLYKYAEVTVTIKEAGSTGSATATTTSNSQSELEPNTAAQNVNANPNTGR